MIIAYPLQKWIDLVAIQQRFVDRNAIYEVFWLNSYGIHTSNFFLNPGLFKQMQTVFFVMLCFQAIETVLTWWSDSTISIILLIFDIKITGMANYALLSALPTFLVLKNMANNDLFCYFIIYNGIKLIIISILVIANPTTAYLPVQFASLFSTLRVFSIKSTVSWFQAD